jgi:hypothetical protein
MVPVEAFEGSLAQAMAQAAAGNSKAKLSMTSAEKSNAAWRLVAVTDLSKAETAKAAGVSEGTVANMRRVHTVLKLREDRNSDALLVSPLGDLADLSWPDAKRLAEGRDKPDFDWEAANAKKAQEWATALAKTFGREAGKNPAVFAMALEIYDSRLMAQMADWAGYTSIEEEDEDQT